MPFQFPDRTLTHRRLPRPELSNALQLLDGFNRLPQEIRVGVPLVGLIVDGLQKNRVLLQMFRGAVEEMLQVKAVSVRVPRSLLQTQRSE